MSGFLNRFSRKERAKRKQAATPQPDLRVPPAYKADLYNPSIHGPRSAHPRPLSSFAPDLSRQAHAYPQQLPRASCDQPPLPTYDPSKYQPIRPTSIPSSEVLYTNPYASNHIPMQSSHLSAAHYQNARSSIYQPAEPARLQPYDSVALRRQSAMPVSSRSAASAQQRLRSEARERSNSEPMPAGPGHSQGSRRRQKPVLSRLITNFN